MIMKHFKVIEQLSFNKRGELVCKKPSGRSYQKAHYKQGDLDGACGAYSLSMVLNILGVFEADDLYKNTEEHDKRTVEWKLIKSLNEWGLYPNGLKTTSIEELVTKNYSKYVSIESTGKKASIPFIVKEFIDKNNPVILGIDYKNGGGHWIVAVGYAMDDDQKLSHILTLDPGNDTPKYSLWNGILNIQRDYRKMFGFHYFSDKEYIVSLEEAIIIRKK